MSEQLYFVQNLLSRKSWQDIMICCGRLVKPSISSVPNLLLKLKLKFKISTVWREKPLLETLLGKVIWVGAQSSGSVHQSIHFSISANAEYLHMDMRQETWGFQMKSVSLHSSVCFIKCWCFFFSTELICMTTLLQLYKGHLPAPNEISMIRL